MSDQAAPKQKQGSQFFPAHDHLVHSNPECTLLLEEKLSAKQTDEVGMDHETLHPAPYRAV